MSVFSKSNDSQDSALFPILCGVIAVHSSSVGLLILIVVYILLKRISNAVLHVIHCIAELNPPCEDRYTKIDMRQKWYSTISSAVHDVIFCVIIVMTTCTLYNTINTPKNNPVMTNKQDVSHIKSIDTEALPKLPSQPTPQVPDKTDPIKRSIDTESLPKKK